MTTEPVTKKQVDHLIRAMGSPMAGMISGLYDVDLKAGRGVLKGNDRCLWTKDKRRITVILCSDGGIVASVSKTPDPEYPL